LKTATKIIANQPSEQRDHKCTYIIHNVLANVLSAIWCAAWSRKTRRCTVHACLDS